MNEKPFVGHIVHYQSHGTPFRSDGSQAYASECRAAIVTRVPYPDDPEIADSVCLTVLNPEGSFFNKDVPHIEPDEDGPAVGGTWHWPEQS